MTRVVDIAGVSAAFNASDAARHDAIDAVVGSLPSHESEPTIQITFGTEPWALPAETWDRADGDIRAWWRGDELLVGHGNFGARATSREAYIGGEGNVGRAFRQVFPYLITHLLAGRERFVLHGAAVERRGRALLVLGGSGSGKSTVAVSARRAGWRVLGDDLVVVRHDRSAGPEVLGIAKPLAAPAEVVEASGLPGRPLSDDPRGRWQLLDDEKATPRWCPIQTTLVSAHGEDLGAELKPLPSQQLVEWLLFSFLSARQPRRLSGFLPAAAAVTRLGGWELRHGADPSARVAQVEAVLGRLNGSRGWSGWVPPPPRSRRDCPC